MSAAIFARLALAEARRGGLAWLALGAAAAGLAVGGFLSQLALTESRMLQAAVVAALLRVCAVFMLAAQIVSSVRREIDEKRLELMLALPLAQLVPALAATLALYLLARSVSALQAIASGPLSQQTLLQDLARRGIDAL